MLVENSPDSHKPVENKQFAAFAAIPRQLALVRVQPRHGKAADGPLRAGEGVCERGL